MSERDPLRAALSDTAGAVRPYIVPPGVEAARRSARRRRARPVLAVCALLAGLLGLAATLPHADERPSPSTSTSASPSASAASPSPSSPLESPSPQNVGAAPQTQRSPRSSCVRRGYAWVEPGPGAYQYTLSGVVEGNTYYRICPGETIRVFWAQYEFLPDGSQRLFATRAYQLTYTKPTVVATVSQPEQCVGALYIVTGGESVKQTIAPGVTDVYRNTVSASYGLGCS